MIVAIWWGKHDTFDRGRSKFIKEDFSGGKWVNFSLLGGIACHPKGFPQRFRERGDSPHLVWETKQHQRRGHFGKKEDTGGTILGDNPAGHCFVLRDLVPTSLFK